MKKVPVCLLLNATWVDPRVHCSHNSYLYLVESVQVQAVHWKEVGGYDFSHAAAHMFTDMFTCLRNSAAVHGKHLIAVLSVKARRSGMSKIRVQPLATW